jgi:hypothetical protein
MGRSAIQENGVPGSKLAAIVVSNGCARGIQLGLRQRRKEDPL